MGEGQVLKGTYMEWIMSRFLLLTFIGIITLIMSEQLAHARRSGGSKIGSSGSYSKSSGSSIRVRGYTTRSGGYVSPHYRSRADRTRLNNWSTRGNINPYTGKVGTQRP